MKNKLLIGMASLVLFQTINAMETEGGEDIDFEEQILQKPITESHRLMVKQTSEKPSYYHVAPKDFYEIENRLGAIKAGYGEYRDAQAVLFDNTNERVRGASFSSNKIPYLVEGLELE